MEQKPDDVVSALYDRADIIESRLAQIEQATTGVLNHFKRLEDEVNSLLAEQSNKPHDTNIEDQLRVAMLKAKAYRSRHSEVLSEYTHLRTELAAVKIELGDTTN